jgi:hypothetical protein
MRRFKHILACLLFACSVPALSAEQDAAMQVSRSVARIAEQAARMLPRQEYQDALATAELGLEIDPVYIPLWRIKAAAETALGLYDAADKSLFVCLLRNPRDTDANILSFINTARRPDMPEEQKLKEISNRMWAVDDDLAADILGAFMQRPDFPEYLSVVLPAWRSTSPGMDKARSILGLYADARFAEAKDALLALPTGVLQSTLSEPLSRLVGHGAITQESLWSVDLGSQREENGDLILTAPPMNQAFSWFRLSPGWRNVLARINTNGGKSETKSLYLRFAASDSYLRITLSDNTILVQERVPEFGLTNILEAPLSLAGGGDLELLLKGERLSLFAGGKNITESPLPVTAILKRGRVAIGTINGGADETEARFSRLGLQKIDDCWQAVEPGLARDQFDQLLRDKDITGVLVAVGTDADPNLASLLLSAGNAGLANYAVLPTGSLDLTALRSPFARLPKTLAERMWSGVVIRPGASPDWQAIAECLALIANSNMETILFLNPGEAEALAEGVRTGKAAFTVDWVLYNNSEAVSPETRSNLDRIYLNSLSNSKHFPRQFRR